MKSGLLYLLLVGLPLSALVGVVQIGQRIIPPMYVGGLWRAIEAAPTQETCNPPGFTVSSPEIEISQSGVVLELIFPGAFSTKSRARLQGATLRSMPAEADASCTASWVLEARIVGAAHDRLEGQWTPVGCEACRPRAFIAARVSEAGTMDHTQDP